MLLCRRRPFIQLLLSAVLASAQRSSGSVSSVSAVTSSGTSVSSTGVSVSFSSASTSVLVASSASASASVLPSSSGSPASTSAGVSQSPIPGLFPATDPLDPPGVEDSETIVPDFSPAWEAALKKASAKVSGFTLQDLVNTATGVEAFGQRQRCVGNTLPISSNGGWPGLCLQDGPLGVRLADRITTFPTGLNTAATFNRSLIRQRGLFMGQEFKDKGVNVALGPMMNMLRVPAAGRNFEGFGADPFLAGETAYETVLGMQQGGVQACSKHFIANEQETSRTTSSSNVDDRTLHEIYAQPFLRAVMAGTASIMCSYNQLNGTYACENNSTLNRMLKEELGFQGFVVSDWGATHSTVLSTTSGLDMDMPGSGGPNNSFFGSTLVSAVQNGSVPMSRVTDLSTRILAAWYFLHQDDPSFPPVNFNGNDQTNEAQNEHIDVQANHKEVVRTIGAASVVLLKNTGGALPLKKPRNLVLIGRDAGPSIVGPNGGPSTSSNTGILGIGGGSGSATFPYLISPYEAIQNHARADHTSISWVLDDFNLAQAVSASARQTAALVFVNTQSSEGSDRGNLTLSDNAEALIQAVAGANSNTMVVIHSIGPVIVDSWIENPNITAVLWAGAAGQETGNAIADVLYGDFNPSGRLPFTIAKQEEDYSARVVSGSGIVQVPYTEGLEIDYRAFDARNITPRFEFGFGLSYTKFEYSNLRISAVNSSSDGDDDLIKNWEAGNPNPFGFGSSTALWLHSPAFEVTFEVKNVGNVAGGEIPQLYIAHPPSAGEPPRVLKGFSDVLLAPGQRKQITIHLSRHSLSIWDNVGQGWKKPEGDFGVVIGASSRDERLNEFSVGLNLAEKSSTPFSPSQSITHGHRSSLPAGWSPDRKRKLQDEDFLPLRFALRQSNAHHISVFLDDVSRPQSRNYGKHWSHEQIISTFAPSNETTAVVLDWLDQNGFNSSRVQLSPSKGWVSVNATVEETETLLKANYYIFTHDTGIQHIACTSYHLPIHVAPHVELVLPSVHFDAIPTKRSRQPFGGLGRPGVFSKHGGDAQMVQNDLNNCHQQITPQCLKALYGMFYIPHFPMYNNSFGIVEYTPQAYLQEDLDIFFRNFSESLVGHSPVLASIDGGYPQRAFQDFTWNGESNLDLEYAMALVSERQPVTLYQVGDVYLGGNDPIQDGIYPDTQVDGGYRGPNDCGIYRPAHVISTSYGYNEADLLPAYASRQCDEYGKLGLMGVTILFSSGDNGVAGDGGYCRTVDGQESQEGTIFTPSFPNGCPYVTSIGATQMNPGASTADPESACRTIAHSGGGFSNYFALPEYQKDDVSTYLRRHNSSFPFPPNVWNSTGTSRAFPDISANGANYVIASNGAFRLAYGTSASTPVVGAMLTMINDARIALGKSPIGFINPAIYSHDFRAAFNDITSGRNPGCGTRGFSTAKGWDPVTGLGTPNFPKLLENWVALP
ncbi:hypothetical protein V5O48_008699 [Marasmius crinis-equi]|uniref:beta-glucosidase n=1 Tax=Marasmius crinis-equi TaxID=585013 RepID=A0ABR3FD56_9AGAR